MERFTSPPEDSLPLLRLYFRALVTGTLRLCWCPVLYVVALSHLNTFIFSQDAASQVQSTSQAQGVDQQVETARRSLLRKTHYLTDEVHTHSPSPWVFHLSTAPDSFPTDFLSSCHSSSPLTSVLSYLGVEEPPAAV